MSKNRLGNKTKQNKTNKKTNKQTNAGFLAFTDSLRKAIFKPKEKRLSTKHKN